MTAVLLLDDPSRVLDPGTPVLRADDLGVARGEAVFETLRVAHGRPAFLQPHLQRLARSAARLDIALPGGWAALARAAAATQTDGFLRLTCTKGAAGQRPVGFAVAGPISAELRAQRADGVRAITLTLGVDAAVRRQSPWLLGGVKTTSYAVNMASLRAAEAAGAQDAVWLSSDGEVLEAPTSTVALVVDGTVLTPPADQVGILAGTTAQVALAACPAPVQARRTTVADLRAADEVMLMSSVRGVAPVVRLDDRDLPIGPVTREVREAFERAVQADTSW